MSAGVVVNQTSTVHDGGVPSHYLHPRVSPEGRVSAVSRPVIYRYGASDRALRPKVPKNQ